MSINAVPLSNIEAMLDILPRQHLQNIIDHVAAILTDNKDDIADLKITAKVETVKAELYVTFIVLGTSGQEYEVTVTSHVT